MHCLRFIGGTKGTRSYSYEDIIIVEGGRGTESNRVQMDRGARGDTSFLSLENGGKWLSHFRNGSHMNSRQRGRP
jgi:hypothetical protein